MRGVDARRRCAVGERKEWGAENVARTDPGSMSVLGKRGSIVKVKVIRNYDLGEYQSKQVGPRRRYSNSWGQSDGNRERKRQRQR